MRILHECKHCPKCPLPIYRLCKHSIQYKHTACGLPLLARNLCQTCSVTTANYTLNRLNHLMTSSQSRVRRSAHARTRHAPAGAKVLRVRIVHAPQSMYSTQHIFSAARPLFATPDRITVRLTNPCGGGGDRTESGPASQQKHITATHRLNNGKIKMRKPNARDGCVRHSRTCPSGAHKGWRRSD